MNALQRLLIFKGILLIAPFGSALPAGAQVQPHRPQSHAQQLPGTVRDRAAIRDADTDRDQVADAGLGTAAIGIAGIYRVGYWTGVRFTPQAPTVSPASVDRLETLDGDGVRVRYQQSSKDPAAIQDDLSLWSYAVPGSPTAPLSLYDHSDRLLWQGRFSGSAIALTTPWIVVIGDTLGLETIGRSELIGRESSIAVSQIASAGDLPDQATGWDGVDLLIINASGTELLASLDQERIAAIIRWVTGGGRLLVTLGRDGKAMLSAAPWLAELIELPARTGSIRLDPASLETYMSSQSPLPTLDGYELPAQGGRTLIFGRTVARQPTRMAIERLAGLGRVVITAFAPDSAEMAAWPQRTALIARLHPGLLDVESERRRQARTTAAVAYDDLAGQIRAALDRFDSHRRTPFSIVSLILLLLIALVGPLDYLLVNRLFGKPLLGWLSFPLSILAIAGLVMVLSTHGGTASAGGKPVADASSALRSNRIEIIDINAAARRPTGRAISLTHIASADAVSIDFAAEVSPELCDLSQDELNDRGGTETSNSSAPRPTRDLLPQPLTGPYGYPSATFGGISIAGEDTSLPAYDIALRADAPHHLFSDIGTLAGGTVGFPIAPSGSKGWMTRWSFRPALGETAGLSQRRGSELVTGSITNPLQVDLLNGVLVYGNWAYLLPTRFRAGQRIETIDALRQKNFRWHLTRREALESSARQDAWNVQMHDDLERLTEVLMFESATGGRDYTGLANRPLSRFDLTHVLAHGHAVLYGRLATPMLQIDLPEERPTVSAVRIILPVAAALPRGR
jgi:hypothetical protein